MPDSSPPGATVLTPGTRHLERDGANATIIAGTFVQLTPRAERERALRQPHLLRHRHAFEFCQAMIAEDVIGDFRAPDVIRFGLAPLYLGYEDLWIAVERMRAILETGRWRDARFAVRGKVT